MTQNTEVARKIVGHHVSLLGGLASRADALVAAVREDRAYAESHAELLDYLDTELLPHADAEEKGLYAAATSPSLTPLVAAMVSDHEHIGALVGELRLARDAVTAAAAGRAVRALFEAHVVKENELLLPELVADASLDLRAVGEGMHELVGGDEGTAGGGANE